MNNNQISSFLHFLYVHVEKLHEKIFLSNKIPFHFQSNIPRKPEISIQVFYIVVIVDFVLYMARCCMQCTNDIELELHWQALQAGRLENKRAGRQAGK